jgi:hypothetical protein
MGQLYVRVSMALSPCLRRYDICRASLICGTEDHILTAVERLLAKEEVEVLRLKNRFLNPTPGATAPRKALFCC